MVPTKLCWQRNDDESTNHQQPHDFFWWSFLRPCIKNNSFWITLNKWNYILHLKWTQRLKTKQTKKNSIMDFESSMWCTICSENRSLCHFDAEWNTRLRSHSHKHTSAFFLLIAKFENRRHTNAQNKFIGSWD